MFVWATDCVFSGCPITSKASSHSGFTCITTLAMLYTLVYYSERICCYIPSNSTVEVMNNKIVIITSQVGASHSVHVYLLYVFIYNH